MVRKILLYGFPIYLYGLEFLLKTFASVVSGSVAGPTLAGAGMGFLLPLTELKKVQVDPKLLALLAPGTIVYSKKDKILSDIVWVVFFISLLVWMYSIYLTIRAVNPAGGAPMNVPLIMGCAVFFASIILAEIKERI